jgi:hypothetical protein
MFDVIGNFAFVGVAFPVERLAGIASKVARIAC